MYRRRAKPLGKTPGSSHSLEQAEDPLNLPGQFQLIGSVCLELWGERDLACTPID